MRTSPLVLLLLLALTLVACASPVVKRGDSVLVTYAGRYPNGTLFDTNDPKLQTEFPAPISHFTTLPVQVGAGQVVPGFENALLGMQKGETKTVLIKAKDAYGGYDPSKTVQIPKHAVFDLEPVFERTVTLNRTMLPTNATVGQNLTTTNFIYRVESLNDTAGQVYLLKPLSDPITIAGMPWNSTLVNETADRITYRHDVQDGATYMTTMGPYTASVNGTNIVLTTQLAVGNGYQTQYGTGRIVKESGDNLVMDFNSPLAGYDLNFTITVADIQEKT